jgi:exopolysaccharide biosynthesis polyprenyl glycosylphosphotransferase
MHDTVSIAEPLARAGAAPVRPAASRPQPTLVRGAGVLALLDGLAAAAAILVVLIGVNLDGMSGGVDRFLSARITVKNILLLAFFATAWPGVLYVFGLYGAKSVRRFGFEASRLMLATTAGCALAMIFPLTSASGSLTLADLQHFWFASLGFGLLVRVGRRTAVRVSQSHVRRVIVVGTGRLAYRVWQELRAAGRCEVIGFVDEPHSRGPLSEKIGKQTIGHLTDLERILMTQAIDEVVIALPVKSRYEQIQYAIDVCEAAGVRAKYGVDLFESTLAFPRYDAEGDRAFVAMQVAPEGYRLVIKRGIDIVGAVAGLVMLAPLMLAVALAIKLTSPGRVIYPQERCGLNKRPLRMYKFRSMYAGADSLQAALEVRNEATGPNFKIKDDPRITPLGRLLRKSSIDELPQLWNVLRGDMSLVGPRPLPWRDVRKITRPSDMRRFSMRPGLTCLWQVQGRSNLDFERWVELDLQYIDSWSLGLDVRILLRTIPAVLSGNGAT